MIMSILSWIIIGFVVGLIARAIVPGRQSIGFWKTTGLGVAGALIGGLISWLFSGGPQAGASYNAFAWPGWILSTVCAVLLLWASLRHGGRRHI